MTPRRRLPTLLLVAAAGACGGDDDAAPTWSAEEVVSATGLLPQVAAAGNGDRFVVYSDGGLKVRRWSASAEAWDPAYTIEGGPTGVATALVAADDRGGAIVAWSTDFGQPLVAAMFEVGADWPAGWHTSEIAPLVGATRLRVSTLDMGANGGAAIGWQEVGPTTSRELHASIFEPGHGWSAEATLATVITANERLPAVAIADLTTELHALAAWDLEVGGRRQVLASSMVYRRADHGGAWSPEVRVDDETALDASNPSVQLDDAAGGVVTYQVRDGDGLVGAIKAVTSEGSFSPPVALTPAGVEDNAAMMAVDPDGGAVVAWRENCAQTTCDVVARRYSDGAWQAPATVGRIDGEPKAIAASGGHALLLMSVQDPGGTWSMHAAELAGDRWTAPHPIESDEAGENGHRSTLGVALAGGGGIAAWLRRSATDDQIVVARCD